MIAKIRRPIYFTSLFVVVVLSIVLLNFQSEIAKMQWKIFGTPVPIAYLTEFTDAQLAYEIGNSYFIDAAPGKYDLKRASVFYERAIYLNPKLSNPWLMLGRIDFLNGDFHSALYKINKIEPKGTDINLADYTGFYYWRGLVNGYIGRFEDAESDFRNVIEGNKLENDGVGAWAAYVDLAWVYFQEGKFEEIREVMEEAVGFYPDNPWVLTMYGTALLNLGSHKEAENVLAHALDEAGKLTPEDWGNAYPGNDPLHARSGLDELLQTIQYNYELASENGDVSE